MLTIKIEHFIDYCKVSTFADKAIESLNFRLKQFNKFVNQTKLKSVNLYYSFIWRNSETVAIISIIIPKVLNQKVFSQMNNFSIRKYCNYCPHNNSKTHCNDCTKFIQSTLKSVNSKRGKDNQSCGNYENRQPDSPTVLPPQTYACYNIGKSY